MVDTKLLRYYISLDSEIRSNSAQSCPTLCSPMDMEFSRQEYWSRLHFLLQGPS